MTNKTFLVFVLKSRDYLSKMFIFKKLSIMLYSANWYMYMFILKS